MSKRDQDDAQEIDDASDRDADAHDAADNAAGVDEGSRASPLWLVAACLCLVAAAALWLLGHADAAFVVAALGVVSWFFNVRVQLRHQNRHRDTETQSGDEDKDGEVG